MSSTQSKPCDEAPADQAVRPSATHPMHELTLSRCIGDRELVTTERISILCFLEEFDKLPIDQEPQEAAGPEAQGARKIR
jgi:hypothetical protein